MCFWVRGQTERCRYGAPISYNQENSSTANRFIPLDHDTTVISPFPKQNPHVQCKELVSKSECDKVSENGE